MKRFLPFLLIVAVALITAGAAVWFYRAKMQPSAASKPVAPQPAMASSGASAAPTPATSATAAPEAVAADAPHARGPADAPVTLEIYGDFQCPSCATTTATIDELEKEFRGKLRVVFYEFPLAMHAHAVEAAMAAEAAGLQGHFWEMHDLLYRYQSIWSKVSNPARFFAAYAQELGLDPVAFAADSKSIVLRSRIMSEGDAGVARGVKNTPTLFVNGTEVRGAFRPGVLRAAIEEALAAKGRA